jgi:hypothetical protein
MGIHLSAVTITAGQWPLRLPIKYFLASIHAGKPPGLQNRAPVVARGVGVRLSEATPHAEDVPSSSRGACPSRLSLNSRFFLLCSLRLQSAKASVPRKQVSR